MGITKKTTKKSGNKSLSKKLTTNKKVNNKPTKGKTPVTTYVPVSHHIYYDGFSYRVRASVNGVRYSQSFSSKKKAFAFRKSILS